MLNVLNDTTKSLIYKSVRKSRWTEEEVGPLESLPVSVTTCVFSPAVPKVNTRAGVQQATYPTNIHGYKSGEMFFISASSDTFKQGHVQTVVCLPR